ncbi:MAG: ATP-binding protein [Pseudomonadota bacterium]
MDGMRLLLVDDEDGFRHPLAKRLEKRGIVCEQAASGEEALALMATRPIDVVVLDVKMPGMDGIETLHRIKEMYPRAEVILLTGHATTQDGVGGIKSGAFDYLSKPIEFEHLHSKIKQAYEKILRDDEKARDAELRAKMEQQMIATERLASLGTLAAGVAHEINNPLAIIAESVGWMQTLLKKKELSDMPLRESFEMALEKIEKSKERAKKITHQLLGFARKTDSVLREITLRELVDEVMQLVGREATNKEIGLAKEFKTDLVAIWSDPYQLRQVLINLVTNAIQATDRGGKVTVIVEGKGDGVTLVVRDTGQGIPRENLERIFEPFFSTKPPGEGTGLGLSVSRGIIEKLGGRIEVDSRLGHGTTFRVSIPKHHRVSKEEAIGKTRLDKVGSSGGVLRHG